MTIYCTIYDENGKANGQLNTDTARLLTGTFDDRKDRGYQLYMMPRSERFFMHTWFMHPDKKSHTTEISRNDAIEAIQSSRGEDDLHDTDRLLCELGTLEFETTE